MTNDAVSAFKLTTRDRMWRALARHVDRRAVSLIASQRLLRALFAASARLSSALPPEITPIRDAHGALWLRPRGVARDAPVLMYLHGGGFTLGSPRTHAGLAAHLAKAAGLRAVLPPYRLAPEHPFPAARDDAIAAHLRLINDGAPPVVMAGDSAGGCLALQVAQHARDQGLPMPRALALIAPIGDLSGEIAARFARATDEILIPPVWPDRIRQAYLRDVDRSDPAVSPLNGDLTGLPPTLIQASCDEALAEDARRLVEAMDHATLDLWPGLPHVWQLHVGRAPAADAAILQMGAFIRGHLRA